MNLKHQLSKLSEAPVALRDVLQAAAVVIVLFGPMVAVVMFPESGLTETLFGTRGRIVVFYAVVIGAAVWIDWRRVKQWVLTGRANIKR